MHETLRGRILPYAILISGMGVATRTLVFLTVVPATQVLRTVDQLVAENNINDTTAIKSVHQHTLVKRAFILFVRDILLFTSQQGRAVCC